MPTKRAHPAQGRKSKEAVIHAALKLFNMSGYNGVSVREIAAKAGVNVALISYYFGGKQGLLEHLMATFFEEYLKVLEKAEREARQEVSPVRRLMLVAERLIYFQQQRFYLSRFVHREMTLDNQLVRELMSSYLVKEKFLFRQIFKPLLYGSQENAIQQEFLMIQFRNLLITPFLQPQYLREVFFMQPSEQDFCAQYIDHIQDWARHMFPEQQNGGSTP